VEIEQHNMESQKSELSHFRPKSGKSAVENSRDKVFSDSLNT
jgi:hypothetical protein